MINESLTSFEQMFKKKSNQIIKDAYVLSIDYLPTALIGRNAEVEKLVEMFSPFHFGKIHDFGQSSIISRILNIFSNVLIIF